MFPILQSKVQKLHISRFLDIYVVSNWQFKDDKNYHVIKIRDGAW